jgi:hypothetical protein
VHQKHHIPCGQARAQILTPACRGPARSKCSQTGFELTQPRERVDWTLVQSGRLHPEQTTRFAVTALPDWTKVQ